MDDPKKIILSVEEVYEKLKEFPDWNYQDDKISKEFVFKNFIEALDFVNRLAPFFEENDHHADIHIYYKKVVFELQRFDIGGKVTEMDFIVAREIERLFLEYQKQPQK